MNHDEYYSKPLYYDIAFDFRDLPAQAGFLEAVFERHTGREVASVLELACGPGYHVREFARRGKRSFGIDLNPEMVAYAQRTADTTGLATTFLTADMRDFRLEQPVDLALLLMDSLAYLTTADDFLRHLHAVAANLTDGGIYFIEASHPAEIFSGKSRAQNSWSATRGDVTVETTFGLPDDPTDSITQVTDTMVIVKVKENGREFEFRDISPQRQYTFQELSALITLSGKFDLVDTYGDFNLNQPLDDSKGAWRMNLVLRKRFR